MHLQVSHGGRTVGSSLPVSVGLGRTRNPSLCCPLAAYSPSQVGRHRVIRNRAAGGPEFETVTASQKLKNQKFDLEYDSV